MTSYVDNGIIHLHGNRCLVKQYSNKYRKSLFLNTDAAVCIYYYTEDTSVSFLTVRGLSWGVESLMFLFLFGGLLCLRNTSLSEITDLWCLFVIYLLPDKYLQVSFHLLPYWPKIFRHCSSPYCVYPWYSDTSTPYHLNKSVPLSVDVFEKQLDEWQIT